LVPRIDKANKQLGYWLNSQCHQYRLLQQGIPSSLTQERIDKLEDLGFVWLNVDDRLWDQRYGELMEYKQKHGDCNVSQRYEANKQLGRWVTTQRQQYRYLQEGKKYAITAERIAKLEAIGFIWKVHS